MLNLTGTLDVCPFSSLETPNQLHYFFSTKITLATLLSLTQCNRTATTTTTHVFVSCPGVSMSSLRTIQSFTTLDTSTSLATSLNSLVIIDSFDENCDNMIEEITRL